MTLSDFDYNDIPNEYIYPVQFKHKDKLRDTELDVRYIEIYKTFLKVLFKDSMDTMFDYTLSKYLDYDEGDYFHENDFTSRTDKFLGYRIDRTWTSAHGTEFYFSK